MFSKIRQKLETVSSVRIRLWVQLCIALICAWMGVKFYLFVQFMESNGTSAIVSRPPGAEGFLPISSLMSLCYTIRTGHVHPFHPAGLVIFVAAILISFIVAKSFCGWICPIGFLSDLLASLRQRVFGRNSLIPAKLAFIVHGLDWLMRSLKYIVLAFFSYAILGMDAKNLEWFLGTNYNLMADVKMYRFFSNVSMTAAVVIAMLTVFSFVIPRFWCRYLCPYGALLGLVGLLSPFKIRRNLASCTDCGKCAKACPSRITVDVVKTVRSDECISCYQCIDACPVNDTLELKAPFVRKPLSARLWGLLSLGLFLLFILLAKLFGYWHNTVPTADYLRLYRVIDYLDHPRSPATLQEPKR